MCPADIFKAKFDSAEIVSKILMKLVLKLFLTVITGINECDIKWIKWNNKWINKYDILCMKNWACTEYFERLHMYPKKGFY